MRNHAELTQHLQQFKSEHTAALIDYTARFAPRWGADSLRTQLQRTHDALTKQRADGSTACHEVNTAQMKVIEEVFTWLDKQIQPQQPMEGIEQ